MEYCQTYLYNNSKPFQTFALQVLQTSSRRQNDRETLLYIGHQQ